MKPIIHITFLALFCLRSTLLIATNTYLLLISLRASSNASAETIDRNTCREGHIQDPTTGTCRSLTRQEYAQYLEQQQQEEQEDDELFDETDGEDLFGDESFDTDMMEDNEYDEEEIITETVEQEVTGSPEEIAGTQKVLQTMLQYMEEELPKQKYDKVRPICINKDKLCAFWASKDECELSPSYMKIDCALACQSCDELDIKNRCPLDPNAMDIWKPGDLNKMFQRIAYELDSSSAKKVQVLSEPSSLENKIGENDGPLPWVVIIDDFISDEECQQLIDSGYRLGYERSRDVGDELPDGTFDAVVSQDRTSTNAWCDQSCLEDEIIYGVLERIANLTGIPVDHSEDLQLLKYEEGQFYSTHHDFIEYQVDRPCGPRILTAFLYLNDVEAGGGTNFPELNITVMPKKGRILLWPSVLDDDPATTDRWTMHQALPVVNGTKYAANGWLHLREYKSVHDAGCD